MRAGYTVVNVNPLYTPRELEFQLTDSGTEAIVVLENFAATLQKAIAQTPVEACRDRPSWATCSARLKGTIVNFVVRRVKKMVPAYSLPEAVTFAEAIAEGRKHKLPYLDVQPFRRRLPAIYRRHHRRREGRNADCIATSSPICCRPRPGCSRRKATEWSARSSSSAALPLYHIFAFTASFLLTMRIGAVTVLIPNPARPARPHRGSS